MATAIVRLTRNKESAPEDLQPIKEGKSRADRKPRRDREERGDRPDRGDRGPRGDRDGGFDRQPRERGRGRPSADFTDGAWIKLGVGRKNNADPKWLVPMLCKAGGFSREAIGVIQISTGSTHVELKPDAASKLMNAAGAEQVIDKSIWVDRSDKPDGEPDERPAPKRRRAPDGPKKHFKRNHDGKPAKFKAKKPRTGPKKPRGPNGEKKRSKKKSGPPAGN